MYLHWKVNDNRHVFKFLRTNTVQYKHKFEKLNKNNNHK